MWWSVSWSIPLSSEEDAARLEVAFLATWSSIASRNDRTVKLSACANRQDAISKGKNFLRYIVVSTHNWASINKIILGNVAYERKVFWAI